MSKEMNHPSGWGLNCMPRRNSERLQREEQREGSSPERSPAVVTQAETEGSREKAGGKW